MGTLVVLISTAIIALSGVPGLLMPRRSALGQWVAMGLNVLASAIGVTGLILHMTRNAPADAVAFSWSLPWGHFAASVDALGVLFLIPMLLVSALGSIYGLSYWEQSTHIANGRKLRLCWGLMTAGMMMVVLARDGVLFLIAWEIMALATFFLVGTQDTKPEVRQAAWVYLVATHVGTLCLFALFALLRFATGSFDLWPVAPGAMAPWIATTVFVLGLIGFGLKAGIMPLHIWLPGAHANAPSHVSAILSGVLLKTGVYGLIRVVAFVPQPPLWWGETLLVLGALSGVAGITFAMAQQDYKRLLAYSSIENIGIIIMGVGLATIGRALGRADLIILGMGGALLHVLNHSLFKPLLFMGAGNLLHAVHTRKIDALGGLGKVMPRTFMLVVIGAVAICGLPPLNGFVSELLLYVGFFRNISAENQPSLVWAALAAPVLALIGALAVSGFVKLLGGVFGGTARTLDPHQAHDPGISMLGPMIVLAAGCVTIGVWPSGLMSLVERAVASWDPMPSRSGQTIAGMVPVAGLSFISLGFVLIALCIGGVIYRLVRRSPWASAGTWDCAYARPTARMQYTGTSFTQMLASLFRWMLWPRVRLPVLRGLFPTQSDFASVVPDPILDRGLLPGFGLARRLSALARPIQRGVVQFYLLYILLALVVLLLIALN